MRGLLLLAASLSRKNCWTRPIWLSILSTVIGVSGAGGGRADGRLEDMLLDSMVSDVRVRESYSEGELYLWFCDW